MGIIISNTLNTVTLNTVVSYIMSKQVNYAYYDIPSKTTPTIDINSFSVKPTRYNIIALINDTDKTTLTTMRGQNDRAFTVDDEEQTAKNVRLESMEFSNNPGYTTNHKWRVTVIFTATDH